MKTALTSLLMWLAVSPCLIAQENTKLTALFGNHLALSFRTVTRPGNQPLATSGAVITSGRQSAHRVVIDQAGRAYLVYKILWEETPSPGLYRLSILAPDPPVVEQCQRELAAGSRRLELPHYPPAQEIAVGDLVTLDILQDPKRHLTIVDTMSVVDPSREPSLSSLSKPPRDFTLRDVELKVIDYTIKTESYELESGGGCSGAIIWFYLPQYGRFLFSITDQPGYGFEQIGAIRDNRISFTYLGKLFEWISKQAILTPGAWKLWVRVDPDYAPQFEPQPGTAVIGAADEIGSLLERER